MRTRLEGEPPHDPDSGMISFPLVTGAFDSTLPQVR